MIQAQGVLLHIASTCLLLARQRRLLAHQQPVLVRQTAARRVARLPQAPRCRTSISRLNKVASAPLTKPWSVRPIQRLHWRPPSASKQTDHCPSSQVAPRRGQIPRLESQGFLRPPVFVLQGKQRPPHSFLYRGEPREPAVLRMPSVPARSRSLHPELLACSTSAKWRPRGPQVGLQSCIESLCSSRDSYLNINTEIVVEDRHSQQHAHRFLLMRGVGA